jgi:DNA-binding NtrC family response regulator
MKKAAVLVVDDEKNIRLTIAQSLAGEAVTVETAVNAEEALEKLQQQAFDLVLLDVRLPGIDGVEALRRIRKDHPQLPVLMLSANSAVDQAVEAMRCGALDFIQKPFAPREIREAVDRALKRSDSGGAAPRESAP